MCEGKGCPPERSRTPHRKSKEASLSFPSHKGVISAFGEHFVKADIFSKEMSKELSKAFEKRQLGDYEYTFVLSKGEAEEILKKGKNFVDKIVQYLKQKKLL